MKEGGEERKNGRREVRREYRKEGGREVRREYRRKEDGRKERNGGGRQGCRVGLYLLVVSTHPT